MKLYTEAITAVVHKFASLLLSSPSLPATHCSMGPDAEGASSALADGPAPAKSRKGADHAVGIISILPASNSQAGG